MQLDTWRAVFLTGCFGALMPELLRWYGLRESPRLPEYATSIRYWLITLLMVLCGGELATLYGTIDVSAIQVVNIGASAPLIISSLSRISPRRKKMRGSDVVGTYPEASIGSFLGGE